MIPFLQFILKILRFTSFYIGIIIHKKNRFIFIHSNHLLKIMNSPTSIIHEYQLNKLNNLLEYAFSHVPYYNNILKQAGFTDYKDNFIYLKSLRELNKLPYLTKNIMHKEGNTLFSDEIKDRRARKNSSGGSTGEKAVFYQDNYYEILTKSNFLLFKRLLGLRPYDNFVLLLWGANRDIGNPNIPNNPIVALSKKIIIINCSKISESDIKKTLSILKHIRFDYIRGYAQSLHLFAVYALNNNIIIKKQNLIISTATKLTESMRQDIENAFGCIVYDFYGSREVGPIAFENHNGQFTTLFDNNIIEIVPILNNTDNTKRGELVVTNLNNYSMPIIRYKIGDICLYNNNQVSHLSFNKILGRTSDYLKTSKGDIVDGTYLTTILNNIDEITKFQIIQEDIFSITIKIISERKIDKNKLYNAEKKIIDIFGTSVKIKWKNVNKINNITETGKHIYIISKIINNANPNYTRNNIL